MTQASNATPAQLNQIASLTSQLAEEETLFGQPSTATSASMSQDFADTVALSDATLASFGVVVPAAPAAAAPTLASAISSGMSILG